jgi:hypothetical protein
MSSKLSPADIENGWTEPEFDRFQVYTANPSTLWDPNDPDQADRILAPDRPAGIGHNSALDPLANLTPWQLFINCIWLSDEDACTKIMLLCIARYMDQELRGGSSMSYSQVANDCGFTERTAKRCAKKVRGIDPESKRVWLKVKIGEGRYVQGKGGENLYYGVIPPDVLDDLRRRKSGMTEGHPETDYGVTHSHPEGERGDSESPAGCLRVTLTSYSSQSEKERGADAPALPLRKDAKPTSRTCSVACSPPQPPPSLPLTNGRDHEHNEHDGGGVSRGRHRRGAPTAPTAEVEQAIELYNEAARRHGWTVLHSRTSEVLARLQNRLAEIGGIEQFKRALSAIPSDDFLMGRVRQEGRKPFKLDMAGLLRCGEHQKGKVSASAAVGALSAETKVEARFRQGFAAHNLKAISISGDPQLVWSSERFSVGGCWPLPCGNRIAKSTPRVGLAARGSLRENADEAARELPESMATGTRNRGRGDAEPAYGVLARLRMRTRSRATLTTLYVLTKKGLTSQVVTHEHGIIGLAWPG